MVERESSRCINCLDELLLGQERLNGGRIMGNRFTITTLTQRELDTIDGCYAKLYKIYNRRKDKVNEAPMPIEALRNALVSMITINDRVKKVERQ